MPVIDVCKSEEIDDATTAKMAHYSNEDTASKRLQARHEVCEEKRCKKSFIDPGSIDLLKTCSQIYTETALLLFLTNTSAFAKPSQFSALIKCLRPAQERALSTITIYRLIVSLDELDRGHAEWTKGDLTGLKTITIF